VEGKEKVAVRIKAPYHTRLVQQPEQLVAQPLGLSFLHTCDTPRDAYKVLELALQRVPAQVNRSLKSTGRVQTLGIFPTLDRRCPKNRRLDMRHNRLGRAISRH
jgi:hypothetical protein